MTLFRGLFIGLTTIDVQYFVSTFPEANIKVKTLPPKILVGGPATNAAVAFAYLNGTAHLASANGNNAFSSFIKNDFEATKINHFDLVHNSSFNPVIASVITSAENGDRNIFTHYPETISSIVSPAELLKQTQPQIILADGFYPEFSLECLKLANSKNIPVVLDCGSWKAQYELLLDFTDFAICSEDFLPPKSQNTDDVFEFLFRKNIHNVAITRGSKSILFTENRVRKEIKVNQLNVKDTLGAGDFFHGAFCYFLRQTNHFHTALKKASELASFTCKFKGTRKWLNFLY